MIDFQTPAWFWMLLALPALALWDRRGARLKRLAWHDLGLNGTPPGSRAHWRLIAAACLILALARPRWGRRAEPEPPSGHDVVILIDVSRSMGAEDAVPNRLATAVEAARGLIAALGREPGDRAAVVAFAGRAVLRCPLTENLGAAADVLAALRPGDVEPGGTDLGAALDGALEAFDDQEHAQGRTVVLLSDGEDHASQWIRAAGRLIDAGVIVHCVAIGDDRQGREVPSGRPDHAPMRYQGEVVASKRVDAALVAIAESTGGAFVKLGLATADLGVLYRARIEPTARAARRARRPAPKHERFDVCLAAALGCALWAERAGPRKPRKRAPKHPATTLVALLALLSMAAGATSVEDPPATEIPPSKAQNQRPDSPAKLFARGRDAFAQRDYNAALAAFEQVAALRPRDPVARFDVAAALFQLGRFEQAREAYLAARARARYQLRARVDFALGNTALALGDVADAVRRYDACLASTAGLAGISMAELRRDAAINRAFALDQSRPTPADAPSESSAATKPNTERTSSKAQANPPGGDRAAASRSAGANPPQVDRNPQPPASAPPPRGEGGAGGSDRDRRPLDMRPKSPDERLDDALQNARDARNRRLDDASPPPDDDGNRKNW